MSATDSIGLFRRQDGTHWYLFSQFEPIDARRAFPCFDEPSFKVPWQLTLHVRKSCDALSNTPIVAESDEPNAMKSVRFAETKPLPSYLVQTSRDAKIASSKYCILPYRRVNYLSIAL